MINRIKVKLIILITLMEYLLDINKIDYTTLDNIKLHSPVPIQGGSYLAKATLHGNPILFQMPQCSTRRGVINSGKRYYCDLLFNYDHTNIIEFIEKVETVVRDKILDKNELWFQDPPSLEEIEYNWNDSVKQTKQNFYLRTYVGNVKTVGKHVTVYNSNQKKINIDSILPNSNIITIVEITGLKFSSSTFHINYCLRQIMVLEEKKPLFNKCLINFTPKKPINEPWKDVNDNTLEKEDHEINNKDLEKPDDDFNIKLELEKEDDEINNNDDEEINDISVNSISDEKSTDNPMIEDDDLVILSQNQPDSVNTHEEYPESESEHDIDTSNNFLSDLEKTTENLDNKMVNLEIKEVELKIPEEEELFHLKKPDTVYLDIYKQALEKAKEAKIKAIQAYLELKQIKNKYMIQEVDEEEVDNLNELNFEL